MERIVSEQMANNLTGLAELYFHKTSSDGRIGCLHHLTSSTKSTTTTHTVIVTGRLNSLVSEKSSNSNNAQVDASFNSRKGEKMFEIKRVVTVS